MRSAQTRQTGFTMMELLVVIAIAAILTGLAVPSFRTMIDNAQRREASTAFYTALTRGRSEAIARNAPILICARDLATVNPPTCASSGNAWQNGWIVYTNTTPNVVLQVHEPLADGFTLSGVISPLSIDANGRVGTGVDYTLCKGSGDTTPRRISISRSGRVSLDAAGSCAS